MRRTAPRWTWRCASARAFGLRGFLRRTALRWTRRRASAGTFGFRGFLRRRWLWWLLGMLLRRLGRLSGVLVADFLCLVKNSTGMSRLVRRCSMRPVCPFKVTRYPAGTETLRTPKELATKLLRPSGDRFPCTHAHGTGDDSPPSRSAIAHAGRTSTGRGVLRVPVRSYRHGLCSEPRPSVRPTRSGLYTGEGLQRLDVGLDAVAAVSGALHRPEHLADQRSRD